MHKVSNHIDEGKSFTEVLLLLATAIMDMPMAVVIPIFRLMKGQPHYDIHSHSVIYMFLIS